MLSRSRTNGPTLQSGTSSGGCIASPSVTESVHRPLEVRSDAKQAIAGLLQCHDLIGSCGYQFIEERLDRFQYKRLAAVAGDQRDAIGVHGGVEQQPVQSTADFHV